MIRLSFQIKYHTEPGFSLAIAGSGAELGDWHRSHRMAWTAGDTWVLDCHVDAPTAIEYKSRPAAVTRRYQLVDDSGAVRRWEASANRRIRAVPPQSRALRIVDLWDFPEFGSQDVQVPPRPPDPQETTAVHLRRSPSRDRV